MEGEPKEPEGQEKVIIRKIESIGDGTKIGVEEELSTTVENLQVLSKISEVFFT